MKIFKKIFKWFIIVLVVFVVAIFVFTSLLINRYKADVEQTFKNQTGMNARIDGNLQLKIFPGFNLVINKLNLINNETYILRTETAEFTLDFKSYFLDQKVLIKAIRLNKPQVFIFKDENGKINFDPINEEVKNSTATVDINLLELNINEGRLLYFDMGHEDTLLISGINLTAEMIKNIGEFEQFQLKNYSFSGKLGINEFQLNAMHLKNFYLKISSAGGKVTFSPDKTAFYGGVLSGNSIIDLTGEDITTSINYTATNFKIDSLLMDFETPWYLKGRMNLETDLKFESFSWNELKQNIQGSLTMSGDNVLVYGFNTEVVVENFENTGNYSAINAGGALMAGPVGAVFTNDESLSTILTNDSGDSLLAKKFISKWSFSNGNAVAEDVAFSDGKYRLAVSGKIDFQNNAYSNLNISLLNISGCPVISQHINGTFPLPVIETISNIGSKQTLKKALSSRKSCTPSYSGSISLP